MPSIQLRDAQIINVIYNSIQVIKRAAKANSLAYQRLHSYFDMLTPWIASLLKEEGWIHEFEDKRERLDLVHCLVTVFNSIALMKRFNDGDVLQTIMNGIKELTDNYQDETILLSTDLDIHFTSLLRVNALLPT